VAKPVLSKDKVGVENRMVRLNRSRKKKVNVVALGRCRERGMGGRLDGSNIRNYHQIITRGMGHRFVYPDCVGNEHSRQKYQERRQKASMLGASSPIGNGKRDLSRFMGKPTSSRRCRLECTRNTVYRVSFSGPEQVHVRKGTWPLPWAILD
jgi:hypothetical protein